MNDEKYRYRRLAYIGISAMLFLLSILLLILGIVNMKYWGKALMIIAIVFIALSVIYACMLGVILNNLKNKYKEFVISDAFITYNFLYSSRQLGVKKNKYAITEEEFNSLGYTKMGDEFEFFTNELVVGDIRGIDFRSEDYAYISNMGNKKKCGRIYALNLKADPSFNLVITKENYTTDLNKLDINPLGFNIYTNNSELAKKTISDKFEAKIEKVVHYGALFIRITNGSLYLIIDGIKDSFSILNNREYGDISNDVEKEVFIINNLIDSFNFTFKEKKEKPLKIK